MQANHSRSRIKSFLVAFFCLASLFSGINAFSVTLNPSTTASEIHTALLKTSSPLTVQAAALLSARASAVATKKTPITESKLYIRLPAEKPSGLQHKTSSPLTVQAAAILSARTSLTTAKNATDADPKLSASLLTNKTLALHTEEKSPNLTKDETISLQEQVFRPVFNSNSSPSFGQELGCLAMNIYQEARGEPEIGKFAVAAVTMNRVKNKYYPSTVCGVVWQPKQFSWTNLKRKYHVIKNTRAWEEALIIAQRFMEGDHWPGVGKATHYHATTVSPNWKNEENLIAQVGNHLFYAL